MSGTKKGKVNGCATVAQRLHSATLSMVEETATVLSGSRDSSSCMVRAAFAAASLPKCRNCRWMTPTPRLLPFCISAWKRSLAPVTMKMSVSSVSLLSLSVP